MDQITSNPGFQHVTEDILLNLDFENLKVCQSVNKIFGEIVAHPIFWLKKFKLIAQNPRLQLLQQINDDIFLDFNLINIPGIQPICEDILLNLDFKNLKVCQSINKTFGEILANPIFWLKKFRLITNNPGLWSLQQINDDALLDFDHEDLEFLESINKTFEQILRNPIFWLKKLRKRKLDCNTLTTCEKRFFSRAKVIGNFIG